MLHIALHLTVPILVAVAFFRPHVLRSSLVMIATMAVDLDHLLADPIYDPQRCSIGFHPLHTAIPIGAYGVLFGLPVVFAKRLEAGRYADNVRVLRLVSLGLLIHMGLDAIDCVG